MNTRLQPIDLNSSRDNLPPATRRVLVAGVVGVQCRWPREQPQPEVHLRAGEATAYRAVAETLADASKAGLAKIGFVSEPEKR